MLKQTNAREVWRIKWGNERLGGSKALNTKDLCEYFGVCLGNHCSPRIALNNVCGEAWSTNRRALTEDKTCGGTGLPLYRVLLQDWGRAGRRESQRVSIWKRSVSPEDFQGLHLGT